MVLPRPCNRLVLITLRKMPIQQTYHLVSEGQTVTIVPGIQHEVEAVHLIVSQSQTFAPDEARLFCQFLERFLEYFPVGQPLVPDEALRLLFQRLDGFLKNFVRSSLLRGLNLVSFRAL